MKKNEQIIIDSICIFLDITYKATYSFHLFLNSCNVCPRDIYPNSRKIYCCHVAKVYCVLGVSQLLSLLSSKIHEAIDHDSQFFPGRVVHQNRAVAGGALASHLHVPDRSLSVKQIVALGRTGHTLVQGEAHVQSSKILGVHEVLHSENTADLLVRHERNVDGALAAYALQLQSANRLEILYSHALHVLTAPRVNVALLVHVGAERRIGPFVLDINRAINIRAGKSRQCRRQSTQM